jgi:hypothetical protein
MPSVVKTMIILPVGMVQEQQQIRGNQLCGTLQAKSFEIQKTGGHIRGKTSTGVVVNVGNCLQAK